MKKPAKYFTWDSILFTIISMILVIIGNATFLLWWLLLSVVLLIIKQHDNIGPGKASLGSAAMFPLVMFLILGSITGSLIIGVIGACYCFYFEYITDMSNEKNMGWVIPIGLGIIIFFLAI